MPVIPSFGKYAPMPSLGQSFTSGANIATDARVARERIAADAAQAAARISLGRAQLAQESVENQMQLEAKKEFYASQAMKQSQEAEIEKSYREIQFGFKERELKNEEAMTAMRLREAAQGFDQRANYERVLPSFIEKFGATEGPQRAWAQTGAGQLGFSGAVNAGEGRAPAMDAATKSSIKLLEGEIGEKRRDLQKIPDNQGNFDKRNSLSNHIADLTFKLHKLFPLSPPSNGAVAPAAQQQWQVNPESIPFGVPKNPSGFIGEPGGTNRFQAPRNTQKTLRILSVKKK